MANLITLSRLLLLAVVVAIPYRGSATWLIANVFLLVFMFVSDGLDGYLARRRNETSLFGAVFDIASDRIVELTLWIVYVDLDLVPLWVLLLFAVRGILVDAIRSSVAAENREVPFAIMKSGIGRWLVAGTGMRIFYAVLKAVTFCLLMLELAVPELWPDFWARSSTVFIDFVSALVYACAAICILRGVPVLLESYIARSRLHTDTE
jgi:CDP-diacylglycerol--glycerol-3-phosphate 3-phosphatidyltransferase